MCSCSCSLCAFFLKGILLESMGPRAWRLKYILHADLRGSLPSWVVKAAVPHACADWLNLVRNLGAAFKGPFKKNITITNKRGKA